MEHRLNLPLTKALMRIQGQTRRSKWFGVPARMNPLDHWVYQEIIFERRPDVIIEIGNSFGGTLYSFAHICDLLGHGRVIGIDINHSILYKEPRNHPRVTLIEGDACESFKKIDVSKDEKVMIVEDSAHTFDITINILRTYSKLIKIDDYFIVEDGICHHGLEVGPNPGPYEAVEVFLAENDSFIADRSREPWFITWNPKGFLKRIK